jgi:hypothetical protein
LPVFTVDKNIKTRKIAIYSTRLTPQTKNHVYNKSIAVLKNAAQNERYSMKNGKMINNNDLINRIFS